MRNPIGKFEDSSRPVLSQAEDDVPPRASVFLVAARVFRRYIINPLTIPLFWLLDTLRSGNLREIGLYLEGGKSIYTDRQRRALRSTTDFVEKNMRDVVSSRSKKELLLRSFDAADLVGAKLICEFGVFKGDSLNLIAGRTHQTVYGFDSFEGLPESFGDHWGKGDFRIAKLPKVKNNVVLVKGWFQETIPTFLESHPAPAGFIHIDSDLYSSCKTVFDLLEDRLIPGTVICFDEFFNYPGWEQGEYKAFQEFIERTGLSYEYIGYNRNGEQVALKLLASA